MRTTMMPEAGRVGARAAQIVRAIQAHPGYQHSTWWATFTGYPLISQWNLDADAEGLLTEALRVLALKAAIFELTVGEEAAAELLVSAPVEEMVHAVLAQFTVMSGMQDDLELTFPHARQLERFDYTHGCLTDDYDAAADWGEQPPRYWLDTAEVQRRLAILNAHYQDAGIGLDGRSHEFDFDTLTTS